MCIQNVNLTFLDKMLNPIYQVHKAELERKKKKKKTKLPSFHNHVVDGIV